MLGRLLLQSVVLFWLVQAVYTGGYGAASGVSNGPQLNENKPQNGRGVGRLLMLSKGVGTQAGHGGYPTKGKGYGTAAGVTNGGRTKGYGTAGLTNGQGGKPQGYGVQGGTANGAQIKGNGYGAQTGVYGGQGTKGNGNGAAASAHNGVGAKGNGHGAAAGPANGNGARANGQGRAGSHPLKGYVRPPYSAGPGVGMGAFGGLGEPQLARNQGKVYSSNGYNGYNGAQTTGGYNGGYGSAGLGLGSRYGHRGIKGPKQGYGGASGVPKGQGVKPNGKGYPSGGANKPVKPGYGNIPNVYGNKPNGYGATRGGATRPQPGFGNGAVPSGYGTKPKGYGAAAQAGVPKAYTARPNGYGMRNGAALGGYGGKPNGYGAGSKPQTTKGVGAASPSEGYGGAAGVPNGQLAKAANSGYGMLPNGKAAKVAGASKVLSPEQLNPAQEERVVPQHRVAPAAPEPASGVLAMVAQGQYQNLHSPLPQGKTYKQMPIIPQATPEPAQAHSQGRDFKLQPAHEPTFMGPQGKPPKAATSGPAPVIPQSNPAPEPAVILPEGYVTGSAVPEQKGAEADVLFGVDRVSEGDSASENTKLLKTKAIPELVAAKSTGNITPEETVTVGLHAVTPEEATLMSQPEAGPDRLGVKGLPAGEPGATGNILGASVSKGQGPKPDCDPSGVPNGQWMKIPRPGYNAGVEPSTGSKTKGYGAGTGVLNAYSAKPNGHGASAGGYSNGGTKANKPGFIAGGYTVPGLSAGYGAGLGYPYAGKPKQPGYGNGYGVSVQPDYASLGQSVPAAEGTTGGAKLIPYNGAPVVPSGLDGMSQFEPQSADLLPSGNVGGVYGGIGNVPFGGQTLGADKRNSKYGIGGLQFAGQPFSTGTNGAGKYGGLVAGIGGVPLPGKYGYGRIPYQAQPVGLGPDTKSSGKYGLTLSPYQPEHLGNNGKIGQYDNRGQYQLQPHESASEGRSGGAYDTAGLPYHPLPLEPDSAGKSYVKGEVQTPPTAFEGEGMSVDRYENVGYINGEVQPEDVAFPAAPSPGPPRAYPSVPSYLPVESHLIPDAVLGAGVEDLPDPAGTASLGLDSAPATETQGVAQVPQQPHDSRQQQLPRQIHIQQHLKLQFHPQNKSWRGANNGKYDVNGFFGKNGYQG